MNINRKLIALCLAISLIPVSTVGAVGVVEMQRIGSAAETQSAVHMERQVTGELNNTVSARQEGIQNVLDARRVDGRSLAASSPVQNYQAARSGQWKLVQRQSQEQLGHTALQMRSTVETAKRTILENEYDGRAWEDLSATEQRRVENSVERILVGTDGDGTTASGSATDMFQPGYIGNTGYAYVVDEDSTVIMHHSLADGFNLVDDADLTVFEDVKAFVEEEGAIRNGETWGIVEYDWEDTTQAGNPVEEKFVAYTYYEDFDWVLAPSVYYYELQTTAQESAKDRIEDSFESYLLTRSVSVNGEERRAYDEIILTTETGQGVVETTRTGETVETRSVSDRSYADEAWFAASKDLEEGEVYVGDVTTRDGTQVVYLASPVYQNGQFAGTVALRFDFGILAALTNDVTVGESGHLSIVNEAGTVLSHPNASVVEAGSSITDESDAGGLASIAQNSITAGGSGLDTYTTAASDGTEDTYYVGYAPLQFGSKQLSLVATVPEADVTAPAAALGQSLSQRTDSARNVFIGLILIAGIAVTGVGYRGARYFSEPIVKLRDQATELAAGRFDRATAIEATDDELGELVVAFESMRENLRQQVTELRTVSQELGEGNLDQDVRTDLPGEFGAIMTDLEDGIERVRQSLVEVHDVADEFAEISNETASSAEEIESASQATAESVEEIAHGAAQQTEQLQSASSEMNNLSATIEEVAASADGVVRTADEASSLAGQGREQAAAATEEISAIETEAVAAVEQVEGLEERMEEINNIVQLITDITEQTNLLALNASIEAARAGEVGKGFAVVANEIGDLADEVENATEDVEDLISEVQADTGATVGDMQAMRERVRSGTETIEGAIEMFDDIAEASEKAEYGVREISDSTESQATSTEEVVSMVDEVSSVSEEMTSQTSNVSAAAEEQTASINEVARNVQTVSASAQSLQELVDEFDVGATAGSGGTPSAASDAGLVEGSSGQGTRSTSATAKLD
ncbi:methyl-accepting chemotaxis protein [Halogeometricum sp. S1BR25-6]|uniref:Methyl-accepting chemotaxis protein n=1 Tax=Halogeometricum salsisoli TaxID=2950536 RepID=A0ABU2GAP2_9EURY|nr:methyl-accepting chemotaxis protein [Halogeometricum sp. S1BR25-6]MDS0297888.1 methyl-accepting chemotaxis protein [Halogeometricum sp. S1BR25-6]